MTNNDELAMQAEQCANILEIISGFEPEDIEGDDVDLRFDLDCMDTGCTISIVEQCQHTADALRALLAERDADKRVIAENAVLFETLRQEVLALERDVDAANARVDTKCAQLCNQDEQIEMLSLRIAELDARTVAHDVGVMNIGNPYCEDHLVAWTVTGRELAAGIYYLDARRVGDIRLEVEEV
mgnify:CR=1 FL=1